MLRPSAPAAAPAQVAAPVAALVAALLALLLPGAARSDELAGPATVLGANVLDIGGIRVRLAGTEAPRPDQICIRDESEWECGRSAVDYLREIIGNQAVRCTVPAEASQAPVAARCLAGPDDLALKMVLAGYAFAFRREGDEYSELEGVARRQRRGLWASDFLLSRDGPVDGDKPR